MNAWIHEETTLALISIQCENFTLSYAWLRPGLGDYVVLLLLFVKTWPEALCSFHSDAVPFFKKLPKRELLRASLTANSVRPSVHPSRGMSSVAWWDIRLSSFPQHHRAESRAEGERAREGARASSMCRCQGGAHRTSVHVPVSPSRHWRSAGMVSRAGFRVLRSVLFK